MALQEEMIKSGNWLFRWRSYLPIGVIVVFLAAIPTHHFNFVHEWADHLWEVFCLLVSFFGLGLRIMTIGYTPRGTSGRNTHKQTAETLNTDGLYSLTRNPLYLGNFFIYLGVALFAHIWWLTVIFVLVFWLYYERIIFAEEAFLRQKFGQPYLDWADQTPVFLPRLKGYRRPPLSFSLRNVLRREFNGFFGIIVVMFAFEMLEEYCCKGGFDMWWGVLLAVGFLVWATLRTLKKHTSVLQVEGR